MNKEEKNLQKKKSTTAKIFYYKLQKIFFSFVVVDGKHFLYLKFFCYLLKELMCEMTTTTFHTNINKKYYRKNK